MDETTQKRCSMCHVTKSLDDFTPQIRGRYGRTARCRDCLRLVTQRKREDPRVKVVEAAAYRDWLTKNRRAKYAYTTAWRANNPEKRRHHEATRRALKRSATIVPFTLSDMLRDWEGDDLFRCAFCDGPYEEIEHVLPLSRGGEHSLANIVPSCVDCNRGVGGKHARDPYEWLAERFPELAPLLKSMVTASEG